MRQATLLIAAAALLAASPAAAATARSGALEISQPWSRPAAAGANGAGFLTVTNHGDADKLVGAESPVASRVEIHSVSITNGVMAMRRETAIAAPAHETLKLAPGGFHLMLIGLKQALKSGDKVPVTLVFERAGRVKADLAVGISAPAAHGGAHH